jgi:hypothetical protein
MPRTKLFSKCKIFVNLDKSEKEFEYEMNSWQSSMEVSPKPSGKRELIIDHVVQSPHIVPDYSPRGFNKHGMVITIWYTVYSV